MEEDDGEGEGEGEAAEDVEEVGDAEAEADGASEGESCTGGCGVSELLSSVASVASVFEESVQMAVLSDSSVFGSDESDVSASDVSSAFVSLSSFVWEFFSSSFGESLSFSGCLSVVLSSLELFVSTFSFSSSDFPSVLSSLACSSFFSLFELDGLSSSSLFG